MARKKHPRNHCWRALLRLVRVGANHVLPSVSNSVTKRQAMAQLEQLCGDYCPTEDEVSSQQDPHEVFAWIVESYTGQPTDKTEVPDMFVNLNNSGYQHTDAFLAKLGDKPWPPSSTVNLTMDAVVAVDEVEAEDIPVRMMSWSEVEAEFEACGCW